MIKFYKLVGRKVVEVADWMDPALFSNDNLDRQIAKTQIDELEVSTVFLVVDHRMSGKGAPVLFETMVFEDGKGDVGNWTERYCTFEQALEGHNRTVEKLRALADVARKIANEIHGA